MNIENLSDLERLKADVTALIKSVKEVDVKSKCYQGMSIGDCSQAKRSKASDSLNFACSERNKLEDDLHATLVDLELTPMLDPWEYAGYRVWTDAGLGRSINRLYKPKQPRKLGDSNAQI